MKQGFDYSGPGRVPDYLLLNISRREWQKKVFELRHNEYLQWKVDKIPEVIEDSLSVGMSGLNHEGHMRLTHRIKALKSVREELSQIYKGNDNEF